MVGARRSRKNSGSHIDASHSRQPLVKGERLVRYEVNAVIIRSGRGRAWAIMGVSYHLNAHRYCFGGLCIVVRIARVKMLPSPCMSHPVRGHRSREQTPGGEI